MMTPNQKRKLVNGINRRLQLAQMLHEGRGETSTLVLSKRTSTDKTTGVLTMDQPKREDFNWAEYESKLKAGIAAIKELDQLVGSAQRYGKHDPDHPYYIYYSSKEYKLLSKFRTAMRYAQEFGNMYLRYLNDPRWLPYMDHELRSYFEYGNKKRIAEDEAAAKWMAERKAQEKRAKPQHHAKTPPISPSRIIDTADLTSKQPVTKTTKTTVPPTDTATWQKQFGSKAKADRVRKDHK